MAGAAPDPVVPGLRGAHGRHSDRADGGSVRDPARSVRLAGSDADAAGAVFRGPAAATGLTSLTPAGRGVRARLEVTARAASVRGPWTGGRGHRTGAGGGGTAGSHAADDLGGDTGRSIWARTSAGQRSAGFSHTDLACHGAVDQCSTVMRRLYFGSVPGWASSIG